MGRTKVLVEQRDDGRLFAGNIEVLFDLLSKRHGRRQRRSLARETQDLLGISSRCHWIHACATCGRRFLGAPAARYCSDECRKPGQVAAAARQQARRSESHQHWLAQERCVACGERLPPGRRRLLDPEASRNFCSGACRQKAYRQRKAGTFEPHPEVVEIWQERHERYRANAERLEAHAEWLRSEPTTSDDT